MSEFLDDRPPMKPWKKWLLRTAAVAVITFGVYVAQGLWGQSGARDRLEEARAHLDATDPGWRFEEIQAARAKRFPPDDRNVAKLAWKIKNDTPNEFDEFLRRADEPTPWLPERDFHRLPNIEKLAEARRMRTLCQDVIARALKLGELTDGGVIPPPVADPMSINLEHTQRIRHAAALLSLNAVVLAADSDGAGAVASCRAGLNLVQGINDEPTMISLLVRVAAAAVAARATERVLGYTEPKAGLAELQAAFLRESQAPALFDGLRGERALLDAAFDHFQTDPNTFRQLGLGSNPLGLLGRFAFRTRLFVEHREALILMTRGLEIARGPSHEWTARFQTEVLDAIEGVLVRLLLPAVEKVVQAALRIQARLRCLAVGIACERFRQANGRWPKDLAEIPQSILDAVPRDPYVDAPLNYRVLPDGIVVYSVGNDRTDDGGKLADLQARPGEDVGARFWSPEFRRAAPAD